MERVRNNTVELWERIRPHAWVIAALTALSLVFATALDFGNQYNEDEWVYIYTILRKNSLLYFANRPLELIYQTAVFRLVGIHPIGIFTSLIVLKVTAAFLIYLLVKRFSPRDALLPLACAMLYLTYLIGDDFFLRQIFMLHRTGTTIFVLLALIFHFEAAERPRLLPIAGSIASAIIAIGSYEGVIPLLGGIPLIVAVLQRDFSRRRSLLLAGWLIVVAASIPYALPMLGLRPSTYGSQIGGVAPRMMLTNLIFQIKAAAAPLIPIRADELARGETSVLLTVGMVLIGFQILKRVLPSNEDEGRPSTWRASSGMLIIGVMAAFLGLLPFLVTRLGSDVFRVHAFALPGEVITLASAVWLVTAAIASARGRTLARVGLIAVIAGVGASRGHTMQQAMSFYGATWDSEAVAIRSLANVVPAVEDHTLLIFDSGSLPDAGFGFQSEVRYLYDDRAEGWIPSRNLIFDSVEVADAGIDFTPSELVQSIGYPGIAARHYDWDEVIFVQADDDLRVHVQETIPAEFSTPARAAQYDPYSRIARGFIPPAVRAILPPIQRAHPAPEPVR